MQHTEQTNEHTVHDSEDVDSSPTRQSSFESKQFHLAVVIAFTILALVPIWGLRSLPLQDYPQHLLYAHMFHERNNPAFDYGKNFTFHLRPGSYVAFYAVTLFFSTFLPIETAGKVTVSLYILAIAALVIKVSRRSRAYPASWVPLLLFPFAFNQQYYLGLMNYLLSLPLLIFALLDHEQLARSAPGVRPVIRHVIWQLALFFTHPFSFLIYIVLALLGVMLFDRKRPGVRRAMLVLLLGAVVFSVWFLAIKSATGSFFNTAFPRFRWYSFSANFIYYLFMFTGMRFFPGAEIISSILWAIIFFIIIRALLAAPKEEHIAYKRFLLFFIVATLAVFTLPFARYEFTFVNLRFAPVSYFLLPVCLADLRLKRMWKWAFLMVVAALMINSAAKQARISHEIDEILPLIKEIPPNSVILPLAFEITSPELNGDMFQPHVLVHDYYHIRVGGGLNPYVWSQPMHPAEYKPGARPPAPLLYRPYLFNWQDHGRYYQYFLLRAAPDAMILYMRRHAELIDHSGKWLLFKRKP